MTYQGDNMLTLRGTIVGIVSGAGKYCVTHPNYYNNETCAWALELEEILESNTQYPTSDAWRVVLEDCDELHEPIIKEEEVSKFRHAFDVIAGRIQPPSTIQSEEGEKEWLDAKVLVFMGHMKQPRTRRILIDNAGRVGLGPESSRVGDQIVVFAGGILSFGIREVIDAGGGFHLLGPVYLYGGWMGGELVPENVEWANITLG